MYQLTHNGQPVGKPHPHRGTCYIEALERGVVTKSGSLTLTTMNLDEYETLA